MSLSPEIAARLRDAAGFVFDMDGTIALGDAQSGGHKALPHAVALLKALNVRRIPFVVFTNGTAKPPADYAASLRRAGFPVDNRQMLTPSSSAAAWLVRSGIGKVRVLGNAGCAAPLRDAGLDVIGPSEAADGVEAVYTGWFREFDFDALEAGCASLWHGARLVTASHVPFFATATGRAIGSSFAINAMLTAMTGKRARVLGKPSRVALDVALATMGLPRRAAAQIVVVGDDPALEMRMANAAGSLSIGMSTGIMKSDADLAERDRPHALLDSLEPLLAAIG
ncbi:HAD-IIA family hydrolase [Novosphingobium lentum]|uniref:HAD-IIA family hydrolase n=1 Tax=Novosphingobium lentum TaxID=145287 RepID=UPI00082C0E56|nr:HAD hydrolase-like protein [Novosphingobium lentum]